MSKKERFYADVMAVHPEVTGSCNLVVVKLPNYETIRFVVDYFRKGNMLILILHCLFMEKMLTSVWLHITM